MSVDTQETSCLCKPLPDINDSGHLCHLLWNADHLHKTYQLPELLIFTIEGRQLIKIRDKNNNCKSRKSVSANCMIKLLSPGNGKTYSYRSGLLSQRSNPIHASTFRWIILLDHELSRYFVTCSSNRLINVLAATHISMHFIYHQRFTFTHAFSLLAIYLAQVHYKLLTSCIYPLQGFNIFAFSTNSSNEA